VNPKKKSDSKSKNPKATNLAAKIVSTQSGFPIEITERKQVEEKLASSQKRLNDLNELQGLLLHPNPIQLKLKLVTESVVQVLDADFARIWIIKPGDRCDTGCMHAQVTEGPHACRFRERCLHLMSSSGRYTNTDSKVHGRVPFGSYKIGRIASGEEAEFLTNTVTSNPRVHNRAWAKEVGLVAFAGYRLVDSDGAPLGVLALFSQQAISAEQNSFLHGIAHIASQVLLAAQAEAKLAQEQYLLRTLLDSLPDHIYFKDRHSQFTHLSESQAKKFGLHDSAEALGKTDFDFFTEEHARSAFAVEQKIIATGQPVIDLEEKETWPDGRVTWVNTTKMPLLDQAGNIIGTFGISSDITDRKQSEVELQASGEAERIFGERLTILSEVTTELSKTDSLDTLCRRAVELGRERLDFDRLSIWFLAEDLTTMRGTFGVDTEGRITDERKETFTIGPDYPSQPVLDNQTPLLRQTDAPLALNGQTVGQGMHVTAGLWDGESIIGYISVDNLLRQRPFRDRDCEIIRLYATAVGHLISLKRTGMKLEASRAAEQSFGERLTVLSETTTELSKADSLDTLCRRAVELGRERLDFDRLSIFFLSEDSNSILGTFGVDAEGRITDERGDQHPVGSETNGSKSNIRSILQSQIPLLRLTDVPLALKGQNVGQGTHVFAGLWDGNTAIGYLTVDNLLRHRPISDRDCEIIRLYASALGHLCSLKRAQEDLRTSEERFTKSFQSNPIATIIDVLPDGRLLDVNETFLSLTGYRREEVIGKTSLELNLWLKPDDGIRFEQGLIEQQSLRDVESQLLKKSGENLHVLASAEIIQIAGQPHGLIMLSDITERKRMEEEIRNLSLTDELTGLYNRRGFTLLGEHEVKLARREKRTMLLFFGDVDNLKTINDTLGHAQGDLALQEVATILKNSFREADIVARIGGDEFVVLAVDASMERADFLTNHIQTILERRKEKGNWPYQLALSLGIAHYDPEAPCTVSELIAQADSRMYQQKQASKGKQ
jgi:diguanylate cyclase (GGDEF)-like protein/PAS domain S-box-containing protein